VDHGDVPVVQSGDGAGLTQEAGLSGAGLEKVVAEKL
jgi:hypothetical protein